MQVKNVALWVRDNRNPEGDIKPQTEPYSAHGSKGTYGNLYKRFV